MLTENVSTLKIHKLTQEQYDRELAAGNIDESALYLTPDEEIDLTPYATKDDLSKKADTGHTHDDRYYTETEIDSKIGSINSTISSHNHDSKYDAKGTAEEQAKVVDDKLTAHTDNADVHVTTTNKSNWNTAYTHAQAAHARTDATKVSDSTTNGNILIDGTETNVYTHPNSGVTAGTYKSVTVNAQGHITGGSNPTTLSGYGITDAESKGAASSALASAKEYTDSVASTKSNTSHNHDSAYDAKGAASSALASAKSYADSAATTAANKVKNDLLNGAGAAYDTLSELGNLIDTNVDAIEALETVAAGKADKTHSHTIADVSGLQSALDSKAATSHGTHVSYSSTAPVMDGTASVGSASTVARSDHKHPTDTSRASKTEFDSHVADTTKHITSSERSNWNAAKSHADSAHAPSNAQANQNAFSNVKVGSTTIAADTTTDTLELVGSNVTITPDATNDKVTIAVADGSTSTKGIVKLTNSTSSTSTTTAATPSSVKSAYDLANTAKTAAANAQATADGKANASHTHNYAGSSSAGGAATSANKVNSSMIVKLNGGTTEGTNMFTFNGSAAKTVNITPSGIGAAASSHTHDDRYYTESEVDSKLSGKANSSHTHSISNITNLQTTLDGKLPLSGGTVTGALTVSNTNGSDSNGLFINRSGSASEQVRHYIDDNVYHLTYTNDETTNSFKFEMTATDTENSNGSNKSTSVITFTNSGNKSTVTANTFSGSLSGNASTATNVAWSGVTSKPSYYDAKAIKGITRSGTTFTYTCMDGTTGTFTQQDNNTTYSAATSSALGLVKIGSNISVSSGTISLTKANVTSALGYTPPTSNTTYSVVTASANGLVPMFDGADGTIDSSSTDWVLTNNNGSIGWYKLPANAFNNTTYSAATQSAQGLMSAADKKKLDGIATGANAYSLPTASSSTLGGVKTTSKVTSTSGLTACPIISGVPYYKDTNTTYSLSSFGITATAAELNYTDGVTSNIQTQLNGKVDLSSAQTVSGVKTFSKGIKIGNATMTYDSTNKRLVISVA